MSRAPLVESGTPSRATTSDRADLGRRLRHAATSSPGYLSVLLLLLFLVFSALRPDAFPSAINLRNITLDASTLLVMSVGMTYVMIAAGFDLSIGSVLVFAGVVSDLVMTGLKTDDGSTIVIGLGVALLAGLAWGVLNGLLITQARVPALITTLGTLGAALGVSQLMTNGIDIRSVPLTLIKFGTSGVLGVRWIVVVAAAVSVAGAIILHLTKFGRHTFLIGSNAEAARRAGINVNRHMLTLYALSGLLAGLAGWLSLARFATTTIEGHSTDALQVITAVVLGGTSLYGGVGTIVGTVIGVFIPSVLQNGFVIINVEPFWQEVAIGVALVAAVFVDQLKRSQRER